MNTTTAPQLKPARIGSISSGTLRSVDLLAAYIGTLEGLILVNGDYFCQPEHFTERDRLNNTIGEAQDCFNDDGDGIREGKEDEAEELLNDTLPNALESFAPPFVFFGSHPGDGADVGFWPMDARDIQDQIEFTSSKAQEYPADDFMGEWLHINERGNCTLYVRENGQDRELWSCV